MWFALVFVLAATPLACGGGDRSAEDAMRSTVAPIVTELLPLTADGRPDPTFTGGR